MIQGDRLEDGPMKDVPSDVMKNAKLAARAKSVSLGKGKKKRPKGFKATMRDCGDALAAARW